MTMRTGLLSGVVCGLLACGLCAAQPQAQPRPPMPAEPMSTNIPANLPVQPLGPNDLLVVTVYDSPELSRSIRVSADGEFRFPMLKKPIRAAGLLPNQVEASIAQSLIEEGILVDPVVIVAVAEYHSRPISVAGAVRTPVTFQAAGPLTLLDAIAKAGGIEKDAAPEIFLTRSEVKDGQVQQTVLRIPVKALVDAGDSRGSLALTGGEEIRVPQAGHIFVAGNVKKPGSFTAPEATDPTVIKAVALAEGLLPFTAKLAYIYRVDALGAKTEIPIHISRIMERKEADVALQPDDVLYVADDKNKRLTVGALEKLLIVGTGATSAVIYAGVH